MSGGSRRRRREGRGKGRKAEVGRIRGGGRRSVRE